MFLIILNVQKSQTQETFDCSIRHHASHELAIIYGNYVHGSNGSAMLFTLKCEISLAQTSIQFKEAP